MNILQERYAFILFDGEGAAPVSFGRTDAAARDRAEKLAHQTGVRVIQAGDFGLTIWTSRMTFSDACKVVGIHH
jgi:hypothetical protein